MEVLACDLPISDPTLDSGVKLLHFGTSASCKKASENINDLHEETLRVSGKHKLTNVGATIAEKSEEWLKGEGKTQNMDRKR